jgi:hypothetical protein
MVYIKAETAEMQMKSEAMAANVLIILIVRDSRRLSNLPQNKY